MQDSPDGLLRQSATVADSMACEFARDYTSNGSEPLTLQQIPGPYVEFVERCVLPQYAHLQVICPSTQYGVSFMIASGAMPVIAFAN